MIKPLNDYVVLVPVEEQEQVTASGIYLGTSNKAKQPMGRVVATRSVVALNLNTIVYYQNGIEIKEDNETYILVKEADLIAKRGEGE